MGSPQYTVAYTVTAVAPLLVHGPARLQRPQLYTGSALSLSKTTFVPSTAVETYVSPTHDAPAIAGPHVPSVTVTRGGTTIGNSFESSVMLKLKELYAGGTGGAGLGGGGLGGGGGYDDRNCTAVTPEQLMRPSAAHIWRMVTTTGREPLFCHGCTSEQDPHPGCAPGVADAFAAATMLEASTFD